MSGVIVPDKQTVKALNDLARHQNILRILQDILRILQDIRIDMEVCEVEGWDKTEYIRKIQKAVIFAETEEKYGGT